MKTFNDDPALKELLLKETIAHREADELVRGTYNETDSETFKGCAVGCAVDTLNRKLGKDYNNGDHEALETEGWYPAWLAYLQDTFFENVTEYKTWPERFVAAIPAGVEFETLERVKWQFLSYLMDENIARVEKLDIDADLKKQVLDAIKGTQKVADDALNTGVWNKGAASAARNAAIEVSVVWGAASATNAVWGAVSAESAASAANAASAAESAARGAEISAETSAYDKHSEKLLELLEASEK
ncbi:hypothetical protein ACMA5I_10235 [Paracoccaceae bacterium GXU_MW_L88]